MFSKREDGTENQKKKDKKVRDKAIHTINVEKTPAKTVGKISKLNVHKIRRRGNSKDYQIKMKWLNNYDSTNQANLIVTSAKHKAK